MDIKKEQKLNFKDMSDLIFALNIEASISFIKRQNEDAYKALLFFSLCPSGLRLEDCHKLFKNWKSVEKMLVDRNMIKVSSSPTLSVLGD